MVRFLFGVFRKDLFVFLEDVVLLLDFFVEGGENLNFWDFKFFLCYLDFLFFIFLFEELFNFLFKDENILLLLVFIFDVLFVLVVLLMLRLLFLFFCLDDFICIGGENVN